MTYWIPSHIQKRLLRYALSQLGLLDTDALDLEQLDIAWGNRTSVELRDVELQTDKLIRLANLPSSIKPVRGLIRSIRLTVPASIFTSGIQVDISGVDVVLQASSSPETEIHRQQAGPTQSDDHILSTNDVAEGFLAEEPAAEIEELEAVLQSQSVAHLDSSSADNQDGEEADQGTGIDMALPGFLAGFLKGITDRLEVTIRDISLSISFEVPSQKLPVQLQSMGSVAASVRFIVDEVIVRGKASAVADITDRRKIEVRGLRLDLTSQRAFFNNLSRVSSPSSPAASQKQTSPVLSRFVSSSPNMATNRTPFETTESTSTSDGATSELGASILFFDQKTVGDTHADPHAIIHTRSLERNEGHHERDRFADASDDEVDLTGSMLTSQMLTSHHRWADPEDEPTESQLFQETELARTEPSAGRPRRQVYGEPNEHAYGNFDRVSRSFSARKPQESVDFRASHLPLGSEGSRSTHSSEDMAESRIYSHDEAQSMYESAMSRVSRGFESLHHARTDTRQVHGSDPIQSDALSEPSTPRRHSIHDHISPVQMSQSSGDSPRTPTSPTTRAYQNLVETKTLLHIDCVGIMVPWAERLDTTGVAQQMSETRLNSVQIQRSPVNMPGAFDEDDDLSSLPSDGPDQGRSACEQMHVDAIYGRDSLMPDLELAIGNVQCQMDLAGGRLGLVLFEAILDASNAAPVTNSGDASQQPPAIQIGVTSSLKITISEVRVSLQEQLGALRSTVDLQFPDTSLVNLSLNGFNFALRSSNTMTVADAHLSSLALGIPGHDIVQFESSSTNTTAHALGEKKQSDIELKYIVSRRRGKEVHVFTAPMHVTLDMVKIDERLECFGGLSGVLDISNTIASQSTVLAPNYERTYRTARPDGLSDVSSKPFTANIVLAAILIDIRGRACAIAVSSKSLTCRLEPSGVQIDLPKVKIRGPVESSSQRRTPFVLAIGGTSVRFIYGPEEEDLSTLLALIAPTRNPYEDDDDILIDTLLRQRKKGSVLRISITEIDAQIVGVEALTKLHGLIDELAKLSNVTRYLPEDDRPGLLTTLRVQTCHVNARINDNICKILVNVDSFLLAHVGLPALLATQVSNVHVLKDETVVIGPLLSLHVEDDLPMIMLKLIGDEIEPTLKVKLYNLGLEYRVSTVMSMLGIEGQATAEELAASMISSVATVKEQSLPLPFSRQSSALSNQSSRSMSKPMRISLFLRDCAAGLNPSREISRAVLLLEHAQADAFISKSEPMHGQCIVYKASLLAVDDIANLDEAIEPTRRAQAFNQASIANIDLVRQGYKVLGSLSTLQVDFQAKESAGDKPDSLEIDVNIELLVLETCADSTQTVIQILDGLKLPSVPSEGLAYFNDPMTAADLLNSFSGDAFDEGELPVDADVFHEQDDYDGIFPVYDDFEVVGPDDRPRMHDSLEQSMISVEEEDLQPIETASQRHMPFSDFSNLQVRSNGQPLPIISDHLYTIYSDDAIHGWHSASNCYGVIPNVGKKDCPLQLKVHLKTFIWNMFDGYDWAKTRDRINQAVEYVQQRAAQRRTSGHRTASREIAEDNESEIGDFLFQSIWIAVPPNRDEGDLRRRIARDMDDVTSDTGTMTTTASGSTNRPMLRKRHSRNLRLDRGKRQKVSVEVRNFDLSLLVLPPSLVETQSSIDVQVGDLEIYDHVPSSTWRKFITYMREAGPRPAGKPMMHFELQNVKPKPELAATEMVIRATVLPLRLHVDQDTLDFITRFFEFKDDSRIPTPKSGEEPFIQRIEIRAVSLKLDYKPKKVDYAGLRSGRAKEFMNFIILDGADIILKRLIVFGISGFDRLHKILNDLWVADVTSNQLPTVLQGLAPLRPLVNVGTGVRNLIVVPMQEYQKDGRLVRSLGKGAVAFARTTTSELARLGARVAIGTGNILQGAETLLSPGLSTSPGRGQEYDSDTHLSTSPSSRVVSSYANQPLTVASGLRSAARQLERDLISARDAIIAVGADIRESDNAGELARAVLRSAPAVILKPAIGTTKAFGTALLGAGNALDAESRNRLEDKYKP